MADPYDIGDAPELVATFRDNSGSLADPDVVHFRYITPDKTLVASQWTQAVPGATISRVSLGVFTASIPLAMPGFYAWHWQGTGAVAVATESDPSTALEVKASGFPAI